jgi:hypothetical protein
MCPACMATLWIVAAGTGSAGGLGALLIKRRSRQPQPSLAVAQPQADPHWQVGSQSHVSPQQQPLLPVAPDS